MSSRDAFAIAVCTAVCTTQCVLLSTCNVPWRSNYRRSRCVQSRFFFMHKSVLYLLSGVVYVVCCFLHITTVQSSRVILTLLVR